MYLRTIIVARKEKKRFCKLNNFRIITKLNSYIQKYDRSVSGYFTKRPSLTG
jgi:hypothetical protein